MIISMTIFSLRLHETQKQNEIERTHVQVSVYSTVIKKTSPERFEARFSRNWLKTLKKSI